LISGGVGFAKTSHFADYAKLKFGNDRDLEIAHEPNINDPDFDANVIRSMSAGNTNKHLYLQTENKLIISNTSTNVQSAIFHIGNGVALNHNTDTRFSTLGAGHLGAGATVFGTMYATNFSGDGSDLTGIDQTKLVDSNDVVRVEAIGTGATITGTLNATSTVAAIPAIIATNTSTSTLPNVIQRWKSGSSAVNLEVQQPSTPNDYQIVSTQQSNGIRFYNGSNGVMILYNNELRLQVQDTVVTIGDVNQPDVDLQVTGDITAFKSSDIRLKDNISPITKALEKVKSISGNTYTKKSDGSSHTGVIAQEIEALGLPGITTTRRSGYLAVDYDKIVPLLIEAIKELSAKVDTLENQINN